jgi:hypothetical protein
MELLQGSGFAGRLTKLSDAGDFIVSLARQGERKNLKIIKLIQHVQKMIAGQIPLDVGSKNMSAVTNCLASVYDPIKMATMPQGTTSWSSRERFSQM